MTIQNDSRWDKSDLAACARHWCLTRVWHIFAIVVLLGAEPAHSGGKAHGIAMNGAPALSEGFANLPYVNPDAPKGGRVIFGEVGGFDSLNPYILKGSAPWPIRVHVVESLMARSYDEPFTLYGLLAESIEVPDDRSWVEFALRQDARFSDGSPVTVEDVIWSFTTLGEQGHPRYRNAWVGVDTVRQTGPRAVRFDLVGGNRELPLILGLRPILKKAQFEGVSFADQDQVTLIGSGPYMIDQAEPARHITFRRNPDWWGADLPVNRGLNNFDTVRYEYFRNEDAMWESIQAGVISLHAERNPVRWADGYGFPAMTSGKMQRGEIVHQRPTGMDGFVFNTRRALFQDRRVRQALALSFDWEWINDRLYRGAYARIRSYFGNSPLGATGAASEAERRLLKPFAESLPDGTLDEMWEPPVSDGKGRNRRNLRAAAKLLDEAGWQIVDGTRAGPDGQPMAFEILVATSRDETLANLWRDMLDRLGVAVSVRLVDRAQYSQRRTDYDFDMVVNRWAMSLSPGTEQRLYFGSDGRTEPGTRNYMGVADAAVDAAIEAILAAREREAFESAVRALDRALTSGVYVIPFGSLPNDRIVWTAGLSRPETASLYGWWGWWAGPAVWWAEP
ncbi:MAG: extracellular solute-binding protein [Pseudomonadota bacterium]